MVLQLDSIPENKGSQENKKSQSKKKRDNYLYAPFQYIGSKRRELEIIDKHAPPEFNLVIDAFGGGGSVSLFYEQKKPEAKIIYNDVAKGLTTLFKIMQDEKQIKELCDWFNVQPVTNEVLREYQKDLADPCKFLYCLKRGFRGIPTSSMINMRKTNGVNAANHDKLDSAELLKYLSHYQRMTILNQNAIDLIKEHKDNPNAFIYLDPPYLDKGTYNGCYDRFELKDIHEIISILKDPSTKAKIMLHIDFSGYTYDVLKDHMKTYYPSNYNVTYLDGKKYHKRYQMIATNY